MQVEPPLTGRASYEVQTPVYDGPFDLLLHLILREQVDVWEVRLSDIVDAYLTELELMDTVDLEVATEFLLIAATLVELKSRRLLPGADDLDLDDELALWEERDLLLARLVECKTFKDVAQALSGMAAEASLSHPRVAGIEDRFLDVAPDLLAGVTAADLRKAFIRAASPNTPPRVDLDHVAPIRASVTDAVAELLDELPRAGMISFRELTRGMVERLEIVVRFLAILELYKQGLIELTQASNFASIEIEWLGPERADLGDLAPMDVYEG
jgi:segregation and condensation protein A